MPRYDSEVRERYFRLRVDEGFSNPKACKLLGIKSPQTGLTWWNEYNVEAAKARRRILGKIPPPKTWEELSPLAQECLRDFDLFSEKFLRRDPMPWRRKSAELSVALLLDRTERHYVVGNTPPGVGKSTLWTHDIPVWINLGGGSLDPAFGRSLRFMLGHESGRVAKHYTLRIRRLYELRRPYYSLDQRKEAEACIAVEYGRLKPDLAESEDKVWAQDQFLVAQLEDVDYYEKEPTFQAASYRSGFIGDRAEYAVWDDLSTDKNSRDPEIAQAVADWTDKVAERRVEPGGVFWLIGQRLGPLDLHRNRLDATWEDDAGVLHKK